MTTLGTMKTRIANELRRGDLSNEIADAIATAIEHYETMRWWFLEVSRNTGVTTVNQQQSYGTSDGLPTDVLDIDDVQATISSSEYLLNPRDKTYMNEVVWSTTRGTGTPEDWAFYDEKLWLYPVPNGAYQLVIDYIQTLGAPSADGSSNAWTDTAEELIRQRAKALIKMDVLESVIAQQQALSLAGRPGSPLSILEESAYKRLKSRNEKMTTVGLVTAYPRRTRFQGAR